MLCWKRGVLVKCLSLNPQKWGVSVNTRMPSSNSRKIKLLKIWEILSRDTDENNPMSTPVLIEKLSEYGIEVDRKILYGGIKLLNEFGYEVMCRRSSSNEYYVEDRKFNIPEIHILWSEPLALLPRRKRMSL